MERYAAIYGKEQSPEVLPARTGCRAFKNLPAHHPPRMARQDEWDGFIKRSEGKTERKTYLKRADKVLCHPMKSVNDINSDLAKGLANEMQKNAMLTRESRRIIDSEEANTDVLIRAYLPPKTAAMPTKP